MTILACRAERCVCFVCIVGVGLSLVVRVVVRVAVVDRFELGCDSPLCLRLGLFVGHLDTPSVHLTFQCLFTHKSHIPAHLTVHPFTICRLCLTHSLSS